MASTTIDTDTELSAVNSILGAIGQSPVTTLGEVNANTSAYDNPEVSFVYNILRDANVDVQNEGWHFNTEKHVTYTPDSDGKIEVGAGILKMDVSDGWSTRYYDVVKRKNTTDGKIYLYDKYDHTDDWSDITSINLDLVRLVSFDDLPSVFQRYIVYRASRVAATNLVTNPQLVQLLQQQENLARSAVMEYECNQGNHSMMGFPENTVYSTYAPWRGLSR